MGKLSRRKKRHQSPSPQTSNPSASATNVHTDTKNDQNVENETRENENIQKQQQEPPPIMLTRVRNIGESLIQFSLIWLIVAGLIKIASHTRANPAYNDNNNNNTQIDQDTVTATVAAAAAEAAASVSLIDTINVNNISYQIPNEMTKPFKSYPDPIGISDEMRESFHPVVMFPKIWVDDDDDDENDNNEEKTTTKKKKKKQKRKQIYNYQVMDHTKSKGQVELIPLETFRLLHDEKSQKPTLSKENKNIPYSVGRYDEKRSLMYDTEMFQDTSVEISGYNGLRTIHIGMDLGGPVGTKVYAFEKGVIHSVGYNADHGDYGNVIVVEHDLVEEEEGKKKVWALYGHLDAKSIKGKVKGKKVKKGQVLGRLGNIHENGGWTAPHVHFQLSTKPPKTHDMPGVVSPTDRPKALVDYPDPRIVLGELY